jgi:hypothetical protein
MGGGLMQLVAYGAQDIYLTGNPQMTFFKVVYRRHTNFAMQTVEQVFSGTVGFGRKMTCTIARNGDLVGRMYLEADIDLNSNTITANTRLGHGIIDYVEVEIGGTTIDKHYGKWMDIWQQLSCNSDQWTTLTSMVDGNMASTSNTGDAKVYVPLNFWFNRNNGLALPLIALQYHEVKLEVKLNEVTGLTTQDAADTDGNANNDTGEPTLSNMQVLCDYIFLDSEERRRFAQVGHEYLIDQVQTNGGNSYAQNDNNVNVNLNFNHPVKELVWTVQDEKHKVSTNFSTNGAMAVNNALITLNGHDRFDRREGTYFRDVQRHQHHTGARANNTTEGNVYVYSFALNPEEHQPSGTCNFSRIDNAQLRLNLANGDDANGREVQVYAVNYNVLRIMSGMGGLAYSN